MVGSILWNALLENIFEIVLRKVSLSLIIRSLLYIRSTDGLALLVSANEEHMEIDKESQRKLKHNKLMDGKQIVYNRLYYTMCQYDIPFFRIQHVSV